MEAEAGSNQQRHNKPTLFKSKDTRKQLNVLFFTLNLQDGTNNSENHTICEGFWEYCGYWFTD